MNNNIINNWYILSDPAIVKGIGAAIRSMRLNRNMTQQEVSVRSGIDRVTLSKLENGGSSTLLTLVQLLRTLGELDVLAAFQESRVSPMQTAQLKGKERQRARKKRDAKN
ncbi:MAG: helix-turn-helix transcriptional regulator [Crocinitomicaceae bacterium]|nr:helix-turn-helix transcriptional regulator [Crocinitomicaceae bacterium]